MQDMRNIVSAAVLRIAKIKDPGIAAVEPHHHLIEDLGFDSLDIAELVSTLEMTTSVDPFASTTASVADCSTVAALCDAYTKQ